MKILLFFKLAWESQIAFYKTSSLMNFLFLAFLHIFIAWNGIQLILQPLHFNFIIDYLSILQNYKNIIDAQSFYIPLYLYICFSLIFIFLGLKYYMEILFSERYESLGKKLNFINLIIPAFLHNVGLVFILSTIYLFFLFIYFMLLAFGIHIEINNLLLLKYSVLYFLSGLLFFNFIVIDFILPELTKGNTFCGQHKCVPTLNS